MIFGVITSLFLWGVGFCVPLIFITQHFDDMVIRW